MPIDLEAQLALAYAQESPQDAKRLAQPVLEAAQASGDTSLLARALACLAECDQLLCAYRDAQAHATRAAQLSETLGDAGGEVNALLIVARSACALGRTESAVEAALLAVELARQVGEPQTTTIALTELGLSLAYNRSFEPARAAFEEAEQVAASHGLALAQLVALARRGSCELMRMVVLRFETGQLPPTDHTDALLDRWAHFKATHDMAALAKPDQRPIQVFVELLTALFLCWRCDLAGARRLLHQTDGWLNDDKLAAWMPWMDPFRVLTACELALAAQDLALAQQHARQLIELGDHTGHERMALLGHLQLCDVLQAQGQPVQALQQAKAMLARERRIRADSLSTRSEVVGWQLHMRRSERSRQELQASARQLEKLSSEDPLTGIANRRFFEAEVKAALGDGATGQRGVCLALLDVDHFKQVNDRHGHVVGDKVLQVVAALLVEHVRDQDFAARLAGDEFVILFRGIDNRAAWDICERLRAALARYPWEHLAPGLQVGLSVGVAQSEAGDDLEALVQRSDAAMYARKRQAHGVA